MKFSSEYPLQNLSFQVAEGERRLRVERSHRVENSFKEVAIESAKEIYKQAMGQTIYLCLSGGVDSEFMAQIFLEADVPFVGLSLKMKDNLNSFDILWAEKYCLQKAIDYEVIEIDAEEFLESGKNLELAEAYKCSSPQLAFHMWLQQQVNGYFVFAGEVPVFRNVFNDRRVLNLAHPDLLSMELQKQKLGLSGCTAFFISSRKMISIYENQPQISQFDLVEPVESRVKLNHDFYWSEHLRWVYKKTLMHMYGYELSDQPTKYSGFEGLHAKEVGVEFEEALSFEAWDVLFKGLEAFNDKYRRPQEKIAGYGMHEVFDIQIVDEAPSGTSKELTV